MLLPSVCYRTSTNRNTCTMLSTNKIYFQKMVILPQHTIIPPDMLTNLHISFPRDSAFRCTRTMHITICWSWSKEQPKGFQVIEGTVTT